MASFAGMVQPAPAGWYTNGNREGCITRPPDRGATVVFRTERKRAIPSARQRMLSLAADISLLLRQTGAHMSISFSNALTPRSGKKVQLVEGG